MEGSRTGAMHDIFTLASYEPKTFADFRVHHMVLYPRAWESYSFPLKLAWGVVPFRADHIIDVPDNQKGVYSFVVEPGIADHPKCAYLLYIGQTTRSFRVRFQEYLRDEAAGIDGRRAHVSGMLCKWKGYLSFCFAHVDDDSDIEAVEDALLSAYLPPANIELPGKLRQKMQFVMGV